MNNPLINPGIGTFVWMLVSFGILAFILIKFGWPMILVALKKREDAIEQSLGEAAKAREEMKSLVAHNEELLRQAKLERDEMLRDARLASDNIIEEARAKATAEPRGRSTMGRAYKYTGAISCCTINKSL